ncbi:MAG: cytochrome b/b6 domain-containing protein [Gammaproteobacteria bacterium]
MVIHRLRAFHAALAILVLLAYLTGDDDSLHYWLGYAVALLILVRLIWGLAGVPQLGLMKYYPRFEGLKLNNAMTHPAISRSLLMAIAVSLTLAVATGIAMDQGRTLGFGLMSDSGSLAGTASDHRRRKEHDRHHPEWLEETHELAGNLVVIAVSLHVTYLLIWKRPLALFMLFLSRPGARRRDAGGEPDA